ncbi:ALP1-like protein isoform X1 [Tanacetum coccineum]|uniref:ALP1-like protein isoform X1 n=1 Tax=Tanacetum coccineum TaxID=301880 RepID=A0ABQ5C9X1_9ASTR
MKTKSRPAKRKSSEDLSMECDKRDISKKHRIASLHRFLDVNTMSTSNDFLQLSPKARTSAESSDDSLYVSANANDNGNGTKPIDKPIGTNIGLALRNNTAEVTPPIEGLPMEDDKRDMCKKYQTTYPYILLDMNTASSNDTNLSAAKDYRNEDQTHKHRPTDKSIGTNIGLPIGNNKPEVATRIEVDIVDPYTLQPCDVLVASFVKSFTVATDPKHTYFKQRQKSARKDVERAFGVLQGRWGLIQQPARAYEVNTLRRIMYAGIIMHNMILEDQNMSVVDWKHVYSNPARSLQTVWIDRCQTQRRKAKELRDKDTHISLQQNLMNHIWREVEEASEED